MTIKKPIKPMKVPAAANAPEAPAGGGATIADRFKLDVPAEAPRGAGKATVFAVAAAFAALIVSGVLTYVMYSHWEFLRFA